MTGVECGGDTRGLAGLPWVAAEVLEGNSVARGFPVGSKPQAWLTSLQHQSQKEPIKPMALKISKVSVCQGEMAGDAKCLLKGQCTKFHLQPLSLGSSKGRAEWTRDA